MMFSSAASLSRVLSRATSQITSRGHRMPASILRRAKKCPNRTSGIRGTTGVLALAVLCLSALVGFAPSAEAQTAHFSWAMTTVGSGFTSPQAVAVDASGNVFVADSSSSTVKEIVAASGYTTISTLGSGFSSPAGIAVDASGNVFVADSGNNAVKEILITDGSVSTLGNGFSNPSGVAVDASGNVFVADTGNSAVKEILAAGGAVSTLGGGFSFSSPTGVAVDPSDNVFVADTGNNAVDEILVASSYNTVNALGSTFLSPTGVALDASGNVFVADNGNSAMKEILKAGGYTTVNTLGSGFSQPKNVAVDVSGNIFVADSGNGAVKEIVTRGVNFGAAAINTVTPPQIQLTFTFDTAGTIIAPAVLTQGATGLDFTDAGTGSCTTNGTTHSYIAGENCTLNVSFTPKFSGVRYGAATLSNSSGALIATAYAYGTGSGPQVTFSPGTQSTLGSSFHLPYGVAVDGTGNVFVADFGNNAVKEILAGGYTTVNTLGSGFSLPYGVAVDGSGNIFVGDSGNNAVKEILAVGGYTTVDTLGSGFSTPRGVAVDGNGNIFVADTDNNAVKEILAVGGYTTVNTLGSGFSSPIGVAVDGTGNVFVADFGNNAVKEILAAGSYTTVNTLGSGFSFPQGVAVDDNGNVFVGDSGNNAVKEILAVGGYTTVTTLGSGLSSPQGVAVDGNGDVFVADSGNNAVVKLDFADPLSLSFASTAVGSTSSDSPQTVTVTNIGNAALTLPVPVTGSNPTIAAGFTIDSSSTCPQLSPSLSAATLAPGTSCTNKISFTPTTVGSISGSLVATDDNLNAAAPGYTTQSIALNGMATAATPTINFTVPNHTYGDAAFTVGATSTSTGALTYTVVSGPATIAGSTVTLTGAGTVVLQASQAADANYLAATQNATFTVATITPTIIFTLPNHAYGDAPFTVSATSTSTGSFTYTVVSGPATISGSTVTLTGVGTVVMSANQAASGNYGTATASTSFTATAAPPVVPTLTFASIGPQIYGTAPFQVSATSASTGAVTYAVVSGPATILGSMVTLTGAGTVVLSASQAASGNYAATTATTSFTVAAGFALTSGTGSTSGTATVASGAAATFTLTLSPGGSATYPDAVTFSATGLPPGATATFSPATIPAGSAATSVTLTIQTTNNQTTLNEKPFSGGPLAPFALGFLLLPLACVKAARRQLRQIPYLMALAATVLSAGALLGLSGCGGSGAGNQPAKSYTVVLTAADVSTGAHSSTNVTLIVQ
jgi:sugar lactone lactonase YvrE